MGKRILEGSFDQPKYIARLEKKNAPRCIGSCFNKICRSDHYFEPATYVNRKIVYGFIPTGLFFLGGGGGEQKHVSYPQGSSS